MVKREFIVERQGRAFVLYAGLLDLAHSEGLKSIRTQLIQLPTDDNSQTAIVFAEIETSKGTFTGIGDANPTNVASAMLRCTIRLAETRAKARALRDAVNVGVAAFEELGDDEPAEEPAQMHATTGQSNGSQRPPSPQQTQPTPIRPAQQAPQPPQNVAGPGIATQAQIRAIYSIGRDQRKLSEQEIDQRSVDLFGAGPAELSKKQASDFITSLKGSQR